MEKNTKIIMYIIYLMCLFYLCVDTVAGILISRGLPNIGQLYKTFLLFLMVLVLLRKKKNSPLFVSMFCVLVFLIPLFSFSNSFSSQSQTILVIFKILSIFVFYLYFSLSHDRKKIIKVIAVNYIVFLFNMLAGITGHTPAMRTAGEEQIGTRGFFFAGNEVSYTFICLTFGLLYVIKNYKWFLYILTVGVSVIVATKACIISAVLIVFFDFYFGLKRNKRIIFTLSFSFIILVCVSYLVNNYEKIPLLNYIVFKFNQHRYGDYPILNALLSGRVSRLPIVSEIYYSCVPIIRLFFGIGFPNTATRLEMDFFEIFYYFGFLFFFLVCAFYIWFIVKAIHNGNKRLVVFNFLCILTSFLVGHVLYSLMGGLFFAIINGFYCKLPPNYITIQQPKKRLNKIYLLIFK